MIGISVGNVGLANSKKVAQMRGKIRVLWPLLESWRMRSLLFTIGWHVATNDPRI